MNSTKHIPILYLCVGILSTGLVGLVVYAMPLANNMMQQGSNAISVGDMNAIMAEMMGTADEAELKIVTPSDRVGQLQPAVLADSTKEFTLDAEPIRWEYADDKTITAWGYNGQVPGPAIRVTEGDKVKFVFTNNLPKATTIHWHGIDVPYTEDGVPGVSQYPIEPGESFTYEFTAEPAGTRFYHTHGSSHSDEAQQMDMGLSGAFIIEPRDFVKPDQDITLILDEWETGSPDGEMHNMAMMGGMAAGHMMNYNLFTINGRAFPDTETIAVKEGEQVRIRLINVGSSTTHPIHLHGQSFKIVAVDGNAVPEVTQLTRDTITVAPGERYDIEFTANNPGAWVIHCHELHHADGGMIMPLLYEGFDLLPADDSSATENIGSTMMQKSNGHNMYGN